MAGSFDIDFIQRQLEGRFGLALFSTEEDIEGGRFDVIRPSDLEHGNGFGIVMSRTHKQFEASFKADNFAGVLLRKMSEADDDAAAQFELIRSLAESGGAKIYTAVNGAELTSISSFEGDWRRLEIDVAKRLPLGKNSAVDTHSIEVDVAATCLSLVLSLLTIEEQQDAGIGGAEGLPEGAVIRVEVNRYERSPVNRAACISHYGLKCQACSFDFSQFYGEVGEGYIEVHHRTPVSLLGADYRVDPIKDLVPVCSNCHSVLHRTNPPMKVETLRDRLNSKGTT